MPPAVFFCIVAVGYYGYCGDSPLTETDGSGTGFLADLCKDWEAEVMRVESLGIGTVRIRNGIVLGITGSALGEMLLSFELNIEERLGSGKQYISWISKEDIVNIYVEAVESETLTGAVNATPYNPEFTTILGSVMKRPTFHPDAALGRQSSVRRNGRKTTV